MQKGDFVRIEYVGRLETGEIFDLTDEKLAKKENIFNSRAFYKPIPIIVGEGFVLRGLDEEIEKMNVDESRKVKIPPEKAFGLRQKDMVRMIPSKEFRKRGFDPQPGQVMDLGDGTKGRIQSVSGGRVRVDFNNPLAGKVLEYEVKVTEKIDKPEEKIKAVVEFFAGLQPEVRISGEAAEILTKVSLPPQLEKTISDLTLKYLPIKNLKFSTIFTKEEKKSENIPTEK